MRIGELAKHSGLSHSRIRFYERLGLLKKVERTANGYRSYPQEALLVLELISNAQQAGFSLEEIRPLIPPNISKWEHRTLVDALRRKILEIEDLESGLRQNKANLLSLIAEIEVKPEDGDCSAHAERLLAKIQRGELPRPKLKISGANIQRHPVRHRLTKTSRR